MDTLLLLQGIDSTLSDEHPDINRSVKHVKKEHYSFIYIYMIQIKRSQSS